MQTSYRKEKDKNQDKDPQSVNDLLNRTSLQQLVQKAQLLAALNAILPSCLSTDLSKHCRVMTISGDKLVLEIDSGAWSTQCHYEKAALLEQLANYPEFRHIQSVNFRIRPRYESQPVQEKKYRNPISSSSIHCLQEVADSISDEKLKEALLRLAEIK